MPVHLDHPVTMVPKVPKDLKVKLVHPVKTEKTVLMAHMDNLDRSVNPAHKVPVDSPAPPVFLVLRDIVVLAVKLAKTENPDVMVNLEHKDLKEIAVPLVLLVHPDNKDHEDILVSLVMPVHADQTVCPVNLAHPAQWVLLDHLDSPEVPDQRENLVLLETKVPKDPKVPVVKMVKLVLLELLVFQEPLVWMVAMELKVQLVMPVHLDLLDSLVHVVPPVLKETWDHLV
jgi:hypothetical protein